MGKGKIVETLPDGTQVRPLDFSITKNVVAIFVSVLLMLWMFLSVAKAYERNPNQPPRGLQSALEPFILFIRDDIAKPLIGEKKYERFMPYLLTLFFFIWINNMMGLIPIFPGGANVTGNIAVTMVLALFTFIITSVSGNRDYWLHMINMPGVPWWLKIPLPLMPFIEIMGMFTKPFVLMVRLFANILAGHIIALGFFSLITVFIESQSLVTTALVLLALLYSVLLVGCLVVPHIGVVALVQQIIAAQGRIDALAEGRALDLGQVGVHGQYRLDIGIYSRVRIYGCIGVGSQFLGGLAEAQQGVGLVNRGQQVMADQSGGQACQKG